MLSKSYSFLSDNNNLLYRYEFECIYALEWFEGRLWFAVKWKNWDEKFNTLEPKENVMGCKGVAELAGLYLALGFGASLSSSVKRRGMTGTSGQDMTSFEGFTRLTSPDDIEVGKNPSLEAVFELLRKNVAENKFCLFLGFYSQSFSF